MEKVTFCLVCGAEADADDEFCPSCAAPLHTEDGLPIPRMRRRKIPVMWLLVLLAIVAVVVLLFVFWDRDPARHAGAAGIPTSPR